jgi:hypothetical protein
MAKADDRDEASRVGFRRKMLSSASVLEVAILVTPQSLDEWSK